MVQIIEMETNEVPIEKRMFLKVEFFSEGYVYALSKKSIGFSFQPVEEWEKEALWKGLIEVEEAKDVITLKLPRQITAFYQITPHNYTIAVNQKSATTLIYIE